MKMLHIFREKYSSTKYERYFPLLWRVGESINHFKSKLKSLKFKIIINNIIMIMLHTFGSNILGTSVTKCEIYLVFLSRAYV